MFLSRIGSLPAFRLVFENKGSRFIAKFLLLFVLLYSINVLWIGLAAEGGVYSKFVDQHLDYISSWRWSLLNASGMLLGLFGIATELIGDYKMRLAGDNHTVTMVYSCIGYGVTSVWAAFTLAMDFGWKKKFFWMITGALGLFLINCCRIIAILLAHDRLQPNTLLDHHAIFNVVAYGFVFLLMYLLVQANERDKLNGERAA